MLQSFDGCRGLVLGHTSFKCWGDGIMKWLNNLLCDGAYHGDLYLEFTAEPEGSGF